MQRCVTVRQRTRTRQAIKPPGSRRNATVQRLSGWHAAEWNRTRQKASSRSLHYHRTCNVCAMSKPEQLPSDQNGQYLGLGSVFRHCSVLRPMWRTWLGLEKAQVFTAFCNSDIESRHHGSPVSHTIPSAHSKTATPPFQASGCSRAKCKECHGRADFSEETYLLPPQTLILHVATNALGFQRSLTALRALDWKQACVYLYT